MSAAVREAIARLDGWTISLWLQGGSYRVGWTGGHQQPSPAGPMRGQVEITDDPDVFLFHRYGRGAVKVKFSQVTIWREVAPPSHPPVEADGGG